MKKVKSIFVKISEHAWLMLVTAFVGLIIFLIGFFFENSSISRAEFNDLLLKEANFKLENAKELSEYRSDIKVIRVEIKNLSISLRELKQEIRR